MVEERKTERNLKEDEKYTQQTAMQQHTELKAISLEGLVQPLLLVVVKKHSLGEYQVRAANFIEKELYAQIGCKLEKCV